MAFKNTLWNSTIVLASLYFPSAAQMVTRIEPRDSVGYRNVAYFANWYVLLTSPNHILTLLGRFMIEITSLPRSPSIN